MTAPPASALTTVDLPVPEAPSSTSVVPGVLYGASAATSPSAARTVRTSTPGACGASSRTAWSGSGCRSALVSTTTGVAPLSHASRSSRSTRRTGSRPDSDAHTSTTSTFAASGWVLLWPEAAPRTSREVRGSTACTASSVTASQSPTVASQGGGRAGSRSGPSAVSTS
jgi:hypothetical protein